MYCSGELRSELHLECRLLKGQDSPVHVCRLQNQEVIEYENRSLQCPTDVQIRGAHGTTNLSALGHAHF